MISHPDLKSDFLSDKNYLRLHKHLGLSFISDSTILSSKSNNPSLLLFHDITRHYYLTSRFYIPKSYRELTDEFIDNFFIANELLNISFEDYIKNNVSRLKRIENEIL